MCQKQYQRGATKRMPADRKSSLHAGQEFLRLHGSQIVLTAMPLYKEPSYRMYDDRTYVQSQCIAPRVLQGQDRRIAFPLAHGYTPGSRLNQLAG